MEENILYDKLQLYNSNIMPKTKKITDYFTAKIPREISNTIQKFIENNSGIFRYRSINEFINEATRIHLNYYEDKIIQQRTINEYKNRVDKKYLKK